MSASVRYKLVTNTTGAALTAAGIAPSDGDEKQLKFLERTLSAADIGAAAGQTQNASGALIFALPAGSSASVLLLFGNTYRTGRMLDSFSDGTAAHITNIQYVQNGLNISVVDHGNDAGVQLAAGDVIVLGLIMGSNP